MSVDGEVAHIRADEITSNLDPQFAVSELVKHAESTLSSIETDLGAGPNPEPQSLDGFKLGLVKSRVLRLAATTLLEQPKALYDNPAGWWREQLDEATSLAKERLADPHRTTEVWMVAAQHPLTNGELPNEEFRRRLDAFVEEYHVAQNEGRFVSVFVGGNRHVDDTSKQKNKPVDRLTLSDAGREYLISQGIPPYIIIGNWWSLAAKGNRGVYNGGDEMSVAAYIFKELPSAKSLHCIVSPGQVDRATLFALANGVLPEFRVPDSLQNFEGFHSDDTLNRLLTAVTYFTDPNWQSERSPLGWLTRRNRRPRDGQGIGSVALSQTIEQS